MKHLWKRLDCYKKTVLTFLFGFIIFSIGYFLVNISGIHCPICQKQFNIGETYLWDTRSGDIFSLSEYLNKASDVMWFAGKHYVPQEASPTIGLSYARFPYEISGSPNYCPTHRSLFHQSELFMILYAASPQSLCYTIPDTEILTPDGHSVKKQLNTNLNCWEIEIQW